MGGAASVAPSFRYTIGVNEIHPLACVHPEAKLGERNYIGPFCYVTKWAVIGDDNHFVSHCCIGTDAQHRTAQSYGGVRIGNGNKFHEFANVHRSTNAALPTIVGNGGYFMKGAHIAHDCVLEDDVTLCNDAALGGRTFIMRGATVGLLSAIHQGQVIGSYAMLGMGTIVTKKAIIVPGEKYAGTSKHMGPNTVGLERAGITAAMRKYELERFYALRKAW